MSAERVGVLVMAHGTPATIDEVPRFLEEIRRRPPTEAEVADLVRRYEAIGGTSPLGAETRAQVEALAHALECAEPGRFVVALGQRHASPRIEEACASLAAAGLRRVIGLVLAPHPSEASIGRYAAEAFAAARRTGLKLSMVRCWHDEPGLQALFAERLEEAMGEAHPVTVFTAHSLPASERAYALAVADTAAAVARAAGLKRWHLGWQSAPADVRGWLRPDVLEILERLAAEGAAAVVLCPVGFVSEHLEVRYDLDVAARARSEQLGLRFARARTIGPDPRLAMLLAEVVRRRASSEP
jgi:ferrochelatase